MTYEKYKSSNATLQQTHAYLQPNLRNPTLLSLSKPSTCYSLISSLSHPLSLSIPSNHNHNFCIIPLLFKIVTKYIYVFTFHMAQYFIQMELSSVFLNLFFGCFFLLRHS